MPVASIQVGLKGESMNLASPNSVSMTRWMDSKLAVQNQQPLMWHKVWEKLPNSPLQFFWNVNFTLISLQCKYCSLTLTHLKEMSHWLWTWKAWGKGKCGSTGKVLAGIGQLKLVATAKIVPMPEDLNLPIVKLDVANLPKDGRARGVNYKTMI